MLVSPAERIRGLAEPRLMRASTSSAMANIDKRTEAAEARSPSQGGTADLRAATQQETRTVALPTYIY